MSREIENPEVEVSAETKRHQEEICALHAMYKEKLARKDIEHQKKVEALIEAYNVKDSEHKIACVKIMDKTKIVDELNKDKESLLLQLKAERKNFKENSSEVRVDSQKAMEQEVRIKLLEKSCKKRRKMLTYVYKQYQALKKQNKQLEQVHLEWHEFFRILKLRKGHQFKGHTQLNEANDETSECQMQCEFFIKSLQQMEFKSKNRGKEQSG
ncbi:unnamed protein product [Orchesella dallaii]|uniref:Uncharacterized protein n=1 Tax=Orchesella dallaii TaxID=48710 RepID=A0ABP1RHT9_9HEXA